MPFNRVNVTSQIVWILIFSLFISGCSKTDGGGEENSKGSANGSMSVTIPASPPGFESIDELGEFDIGDYTDTAKKHIKKVTLSANWSAEKDFDKSWNDFTEEEKQEFDSLVETLVTKITKAVETKGGTFPVNRPSDGSVYGKWIVKHDDKYAGALWEAPSKWRVDFNSLKTDLETPNINIFISRFIIEGEE